MTAQTWAGVLSWPTSALWIAVEKLEQLHHDLGKRLTLPTWEVELSARKMQGYASASPN